MTNPKLVDLAPTWAEYCGWSVIYDRLGPDPRTPGERLENVSTSKAGALGFRLAELSDRLQLSLGSWSIAWLPAETFHVTVMDGLATHLAQHVRGLRGRRLRRRLESGLRRQDAAALTGGCSAEVARVVNGTSARPTTFRPSSIARRGTAFLLELEPDEGSVADFQDLCHLRADALTALQRSTGLNLLSPWRPHVTLGYFADRSEAARFENLVTVGAAQLSPDLLATDVTLRSSAIYTFTSMVDFVRVPHIRI